MPLPFIRLQRIHPQPSLRWPLPRQKQFQLRPVLRPLPRRPWCVQRHLQFPPPRQSPLQ
jgi:hypothetical protein